MQITSHKNSMDIILQVLCELNATRFGNYQEYSNLFTNWNDTVKSFVNNHKTRSRYRNIPRLWCEGGPGFSRMSKYNWNWKWYEQNTGNFILSCRYSLDLFSDEYSRRKTRKVLSGRNYSLRLNHCLCSKTKFWRGKWENRSIKIP